MATHPYYGPGNVVIDSCGQCELIWLDFGELEQIVAAPGKDRGSREQVLRETANPPVVTVGDAAPFGGPDVVDVLLALRKFF